MIIGTKKCIKEKLEQGYLKSQYKKWNKKFIVFPRTLEDGRVAFFEFVEAMAPIVLNEKGTYESLHGVFPHRYRAIGSDEE